MTQKQILFVDDDPDFQKIISIRLEAAGFDVVTAQNGSEALEKLQDITPDLVLLDMQMPVMNGAETLTRIRQDERLKDLRVLFLTNLGNENPEDASSNEKFAKEAGALDYIKKTEDARDIIARISKLINH